MKKEDLLLSSISKKDHTQSSREHYSFQSILYQNYKKVHKSYDQIFQIPKLSIIIAIFFIKTFLSEIYTTYNVFLNEKVSVMTGEPFASNSYIWIVIGVIVFGF